MYSWQTTWEDYYQILGVDRHATHDQIHKAWKKAQYANGRIPLDADPAIRSFAEQRQKDLNRARDVLENPTEKLNYDQEYDKRVPGSAHAAGPKKSTGDSADSANGSTGSSTRTRGAFGSSTPPKDGEPVIETDDNDVSMEFEDGERIRFSFTVRHASGTLPSNWKLGIKVVNGDWLDKSAFTLDPPNNFPMRVTVTLPAMAVGDHFGELELSLIEM